MLSDNIRKFRKENNMSQDELAEKLNVSRQSVSLWESGQTQPTIDNIMALAKIFNISANDLLQDNKEPAAVKPAAPKAKNSKSALLILIPVVLVAVAGLIILFIFLGKGSTGSETSEPVSASESEFGESQTAKAKSSAGGSSKASTTTSTGKSQKFDLFTYCKDFAIKKGNLNGDYTIYQQPSSKYGGYEDEYFSISYWGDSNMVEFCLHCPLDDTYSINFYLRMRGGYKGKYEYSSSRYYRSNGESLRSAYGYIDPAVFSEKYPLNCDEYIGSTNGQDEFMEETRVGMCDLIKCLKKFVSVEKMDCNFSAFGFKNF